MMIKSLLIILIIFSLVGAVSFFLALYNFLLSVNGIRGNRQNIASLLGPFSFVFSSNFDEKGNIHRNKFAKYLLLTIVSIIIVTGLKLAIDKLHTEKQALQETSLTIKSTQTINP